MVGFFIWMYVTAVSVSGLPASIDQNQEFEIDTNLTCTNCSSDSYLRAVFYPGGTSYFGFTQNNSGQWINAPGGSCLEYFKIPSGDVSEGSWSGKLKVKPDTGSAFFQGPGEYLFKIGRYTGSCSSPTWSTETTISITGPTHTPTPGPTQTPVPTATAKPTPTATHTPVPTKIIPNTPTITPAQTPVSSPSATPAVLGETIQKKPPNAIVISLSLVGLGMGIIALTLVWQKRNAIINK